MDFGGNKPFPMEQFGSFMDMDDPTAIPHGLAILAKNTRFLPNTIGCRYGLKTTATAGDGGDGGGGSGGGLG